MILAQDTFFVYKSYMKVAAIILVIYRGLYVTSFLEWLQVPECF